MVTFAVLNAVTVTVIVNHLHMRIQTEPCETSVERHVSMRGVFLSCVVD